MTSALIDFTSGTIGGIACVYVGQPLDTIKVKLQTFPHLYKNSLKCLIQTYKKDGIYKGLYAGTIPALAANIAENSILFMSYGLCQKTICLLTNKIDIKQLNSFENALSGSSAAFFASLVLCPTELVKCKLQSFREMSNKSAIGPFKLTKQIWQENGIRGFYHGLTSTFAREMPGYFFFFGAYEFSRTLLKDLKNLKSKESLGVVSTAFCGGLGGVSFWLSIYPADVIKSRVQCNSNSIVASKSFFQALKFIAHTEGLLKLYSGLAPTLVRSFFATGALFVCVEWTRKLLINI